MALTLICEQPPYSSLLMLAGAVLTDPEPMLARLVRGCIAMAFTASGPADQSSHHLVDTRVSLMQMRLHADSDCM